MPKRSTSPYGVPAVTSPTPPQGEDWETPDTGAREIEYTERTRRKHDDDTPIGLEAADAEAEFRLRNRVKETNTNVKAVKVATDTGVTTIRTEMQGHVTRLEGKIGEVKTETKALSTKVDDLGGHVLGAMGTVNEAMIQMGVVAKDRLASAGIADRDRADARKQSRSLWYKAGAGVLKVMIAAGVVIVTALATHYAERC